MTDNGNSNDLLALTTEIVAAHVSNNTVSVGDLPALINQVYQSLATIGKVLPTPAERPQPAVSVKRSVHPDYIICLEDGKKLKMLKRHLKTAYNMTPGRISRALAAAARLSDGRAQLCAAAQRLAKEIGLGHARQAKRRGVSGGRCGRVNSLSIHSGFAL